MKNIVLIGYMGTGKTSVGAEVSLRLCTKFIDTDKYIERAAHKSISRIFEEDGEKKFRDMENKLCRFLKTQNNMVIATGGGIILNEDNMLHLKYNSVAVYIKDDVDVLYGRVKRAGTRPLAQDYERFVMLYLEREALYRRYADITVDARQKTVRDLSHEVIFEFFKT